MKMKMKKGDKRMDNQIITLTVNGKKVDFIVMEIFEMNEQDYIALLPVEEIEKVEESERDETGFLLLRMDTDEEGNHHLSDIDDESEYSVAMMALKEIFEMPDDQDYELEMNVFAGENRMKLGDEEEDLFNATVEDYFKSIGRTCEINGNCVLSEGVVYLLDRTEDKCTQVTPEEYPRIIKEDLDKLIAQMDEVKAKEEASIEEKNNSELTEREKEATKKVPDNQTESPIIKAKKKVNKLRRDSKDGDIDCESFDDAIDEVIWELREVISDIDSIEVACNIIKGHMVYLSDLPGTIAWAKNGDEEVDLEECLPCKNEKERLILLKANNKEWVKGIVSGILDVVKDYVLEEGCYDDEDEYGDYDYLCVDEGNNFWEDLATCYLDEDYVGEIPMRPTRKDYKAARERWIHKSQKNNPRIKGLVDYKVKLEHELASVLTVEFCDPRINVMPRSEKLAIAFKTLCAELFEDLQKQLDKLQR